ncbi:carboxypeptidase regulatory-like domain-containing protein [Georgenia yuyongxinii]
MTTYLPAPTSAPSVVVVPGAHAPAGHEATVRVHLRNLADGLREMSLTVLGLDAEWLPGPVRTGTVAPDETVTVELPVRVGAGAVPGTYPFALAVEAYLVGAPAARPSARTLLDSTLEVDAPSEVVLTVEPAETRAVLRRKVNVVLSNSGEEPVPLEVTTVTERGLRMSVPDAVTVPARGTVTVPAKLSVLRPQIIGHRNRMAYTVTARGRQAPAKFRGTLTARPLLGFTGMRVVAVVAALALWVAGLGMGVPWLSEKVTAEQGEVLAEGGADGAGADPDGGADGGEGGGGEGGGVAEGVRIGGVVAGTDPAGVRVDIAPASVLDLQTVPTAEEAAAGDGERTASASDRGGLGANLALGGGGGGSGGGGMLGTAVPGLLGAALAGPLPAAVDSDEPTGKTPAGALAITRTEALDAARSTSTLEDGTWAFAGMSATTNYLITLSKPGYQTQRFLVSGAEAAAAALETELVAGAGRLAGTVTGPDGPAGGADITITDGTTTVTTSTNTTGDVGAWAVEGLSTPATYLVTAAGANLGAQAALVTLAAGSQERVDLTLTDATTTLTGKATGPDSLGAVGGLGGITVTATDGTTTRTASTATGELAGTFVLADLPVPATYTVTVEADGYASQSREMQLTAGADAAADFRLGVSTGVVQGTVRTPDGTGLDGVGLTLSDDENTYKTMNASDDAGSFRLNGVAPGEYVLQAELFGHVPGFAQLTVEAGSVATADLVLTPVPDNGLVQTGRIQGRVSDATTNGQITCPSDVAAADCVITVEMKAQDGEDGSTRDITVTTAPDLEYTIPAADGTGLLPGLYTLTISAPGYEAGEVRVQVPMGETAQASPVALYRSPSITGVIAARVGTVPADTCVVAAPAGTPADGACLVDSGAVCKVADAAETVRCAPVATNGSYTLDQLASGTWSVSVRTPQGSEYLDVPPVSLTLEPGELRRYDATLDRLAHVALTVLYDRGGSILEPATTATITPIRIDSGDTPEPLTTDATGYALITHLPVGSYRFDVAYTPAGSARTYTGATPILTVGLNQELTRQLVLTGGTGYPIEGQVFTSLGAGGTPPIAGLEVKVTGITGYSGLVPVRESVTMTTAVADPATGSLPTGSSG